MPSQQRTPAARQPSRKRVCTALTTAGQPCQRAVVPGLTVCKSHGGGTAASVRAGKRAVVEQQAAVLWGINPSAGSISVEEELQRLARNKATDVMALRIMLGEEGSEHIGLLLESREVTKSEVEDDVLTTIKTKRASGTSPWVQELHKAEMELVTILRLLQEVTGGTDEVDTRRVRIQTAREAARLLKAFPALSADDVAAEVAKRAS